MSSLTKTQLIEFDKIVDSQSDDFGIAADRIERLAPDRLANAKEYAVHILSQEYSEQVCVRMSFLGWYILVASDRMELPQKLADLGQLIRVVFGFIDEPFALPVQAWENLPNIAFDLVHEFDKTDGLRFEDFFKDKRHAFYAEGDKIEERLAADPKYSKAYKAWSESHRP